MHSGDQCTAWWWGLQYYIVYLKFAKSGQMSSCPFYIFRPCQGLTGPFQFLFTLCFLSHRITFPYHYSLPKSMIPFVMFFFHVSFFLFQFPLENYLTYSKFIKATCTVFPFKWILTFLFAGHDDCFLPWHHLP